MGAIFHLILLRIVLALDHFLYPQSQCQQDVCPAEISVSECELRRKFDVDGDGAGEDSRPWWKAFPVRILIGMTAVLSIFAVYWRFRAPKEDLPMAVRTPNYDSLPVLMYISQKALQKANQGLEWTIQSLEIDEDGDEAHAFLGPFLFSSTTNNGYDEKIPMKN
ncbi:hypothetical protein AAMO2058_000581600 [Amorphochlora amoebiformis]